MADDSPEKGARLAVVARNLRYSYPPLHPDGEPIAALRGIDLEIAEGECLAIVGPLGAGKSTFCLALAGLVPHALGGLFGGELLIQGTDTRRVQPADLCRTVGLVFQDPEAQLFNATVEDEVAFGPESLALPREEIARRIDWALGAVGLDGLRGRSPRELSGGQKQRLALAAALAMRPAILVLDEPTASLDPRGAAELYAALSELRRTISPTIVLVEQDVERVAEFADRVAIFEGGRVAALGSAAETFGQPSRDIARPAVSELADRLRPALPDLPPLVTLGEAEAALGRALTPTLSQSEREQPSPLPFREGGQGVRSDPIISTRGLWYEYESGVQALRGIDLDIYPAERLAIVGQNGSGKTTLAKHFVGLLRPTRGSVLVSGADARPRSIGELARTVGFVFQNPDHQIFAASVFEELAFGPRQLGFAEAAVHERVEEALVFFGLAQHRAEPPAALGYGLRRAVGLAAVLTMRPRVLVLDEPFTGLDWLATERVLGWLRALNDAGHTIVLITHNMRAVAEFAERALLMTDGKCLALQPPRTLFADDALLAKSGLARPQAAELAWRLRPLGLRRLSLDLEEITEDFLGALRRAAVAASPSRPAD